MQRQLPVLEITQGAISYTYCTMKNARHLVIFTWRRGFWMIFYRYIASQVLRASTCFSASTGLTRLSCTGRPIHAIPFWPSYPRYRIRAVLSRLSWTPLLSRFSCHGCPVPFAPSQMSCPSTLVPQLSWPSCPVLALMFRPSCSNRIFIYNYNR